MAKAKPSGPPQKFLLPDKPIDSVDAYLAMGGGQALKKVLNTAPGRIISELKQSGLRGRGGAGFPTGAKWASVAMDPCPTKYFVCNGAEGEPGTFKDRMLMRRNPYQLLEGIAIGAYTIRAKRAYLAIKRSFEKEAAAIQRALKEMAARDLLGPTPIELAFGPEDYLFGEEKALLEVIEGHDAMPREADFPPYVKGLFSTLPNELNPAVVNNVETLSNVSHIIRHGAEWFRAIGTHDTPGTMVLTISGDVERPGVYELPMGAPLRELVENCGGWTRSGRKAKAIFPGVSSGVIRPTYLDTPMDFGSMKRIGSGLGSGGFLVYDDSACMVQLAHLFSEFLWLESCGQCTSCKYGTSRSTFYLKKIMDGDGDETDVDYVIQGAILAPHANRCYLPMEHSLLIPSIVHNYSQEFIQHYHRGCQNCRQATLPMMRDYDEAEHRFSYSPGRKSP